MQHKWMVVLTTLVLCSLLLTPAGSARAQAQPQTRAQAMEPGCPPYEPGLLQDQDRDLLRSLPGECIKTYKETAQRPASAEGTDVKTELTGGPDDFGYTYDNTAPYSLVSATTNSGLTGYDQFAGPIDIGFNFPFYGLPQSRLFFNINGLITFDGGSTDAGGFATVEELEPNNLIAPFWDYLSLGNPSPTGAVYYEKGGTAPNRYLVVEWRDVRLDYGSYQNVSFSFEAILHENGDIVFQYKSLPPEFWANYIGIEDSIGYQRLRYTENLTESNAIRFYYPTTPTARLSVSPILQAGGFAPINGYKAFPIKIINGGTLGADRYDLTVSSAWTTSFYDSDGNTPLTDTDGNGLIDTGPMPQGTATTVIARAFTPQGAQVGDNDMATVTITSSLNAVKTRTIYLFPSVPAGFASVFQDEANGAMSFMLSHAGGSQISKVTANGHYGRDVAIAKLTNNNYFYTWYRHYFDGNKWTEDIEYALLSPTGNVVRSVSKLTNNAGAAIRTYDDQPAVAVAPDGTVGVVWVRYMYNASTTRRNYNIYFATLNTAGSLLAGPTNITNNTVWSLGGDLNISRFRTPSIAASSDNRFVIAWNEYKNIDIWNTYEYNNWYAIRDTAGANVYSPHTLTGDHESFAPILNSLTGGKVIATWQSYSWTNGEPGSQYGVISSNGSRLMPTYNFGTVSYTTPDAVQLPNGKVAIALHTATDIQFVILNSSYIPERHIGASTPVPSSGASLSVTTDAYSRVIMTWATGRSYNQHYYALGDSTGTFLTPPMIYKTTGGFTENSWNGQGNAPYQPILVVSGNAGVAGATLTYMDDGVKTVTSQPNGDYSFVVPSNWSGTVTPSHPCFTFAPANRTYDNVISYHTAQDYTPTLVPSSGCADIDISVGGASQARFGVPSQGSTRASFSGVNNGPVMIESTNALPLIGAERVVYKVNNVPASYTEMMGLPDKQLDTIYWLPWYNNIDLDTQLRFANVSGSTATIHIYIGKDEMQGSPFTLGVGESNRKSFPGVSAGPVKIESDVPIVAAERIVYKVNNTNTSFTEMMALPNAQLDTTYYFPWYNNVELDTQLRFANVSDTPASVRIYINNVEMTGSPFTLEPGVSTRQSFAGINAGPVKIVSDVPIVAAERVVYKAAGVNTSFTETMGLPAKQLDTTYWLPWYNNVELDTQLRFANVSDTAATVHVYIGGVEMTGSPFTLDPGASTRQSFAGINAGPVQIVSDVPIVAAARVVFKVNGVGTSFSEIMGLPDGVLDPIYWLPWYNNLDLDTQLRFGVP